MRFNLWASDKAAGDERFFVFVRALGDRHGASLGSL